MAVWNKVILSGSAASLQTLTLDTDLGVAHGGTGLSATSASAFLIGSDSATFTTVGSNGIGRVLRETGARSVNISGSFSGSFIGDGSGLTGLPAGFAGPNESIQFNDVGAVSGSSTFRFKKSTNVVELTGSLNIGHTNTITSTTDQFVLGNNNIIHSGEDNAIIGAIYSEIDGVRSVILAGDSNYIYSGSESSAILGGVNNIIQLASAYNAIIGGTNNEISNLSHGATIAGLGLIVSGTQQVAVGKYNKRGNSTALFIIGSGSGQSDALRQDLAVFAPGSIQLNAGTTGSFSGSFRGDGSGLTGLLADSSFSILAADNTGTTFNTATDAMRFISASAHGFGFTVSETSNTASISLTTPQDLRTTASPTFAGMTVNGNATVTGNFTVLGDTTVLNVSNLLIEDRFLIINSGSNTGDGGLIVQSGSAGYGAAFAWDDSISRWGFQQNTLLTHSASTFTPEAYAAAVIDVDGGQTVTNAFTRNGNIRIEGGEVYIYA